MDRSRQIDLFVLATPGLSGGDLAACTACLDASERARAQRLPEGPARRDFIAAHGLARFALSRRHPARPPAAWQFVTGAQGKPEVVAPPHLAISLTHTRDLVAVAVAEAPGCDLGLDAERIVPARATAETAAVFCTPREAAALAAIADRQEKHRRFFALWTLKESLLKAGGTGFATAPQTLACTLEPLAVVTAPPAGAGRIWTAWHGPVGAHHHLAMAALSAAPAGAPLQLAVWPMTGICDLARSGDAGHTGADISLASVGFADEAGA